MRIKTALFLCLLLLVGAASAEPYLGFDLCNDTSDAVAQKLADQGLKIEARDSDVIRVDNFPVVEVNLKAGIYFYKGKLISITFNGGEIKTLYEKLKLKYGKPRFETKREEIAVVNYLYFRKTSLTNIALVEVTFDSSPNESTLMVSFDCVPLGKLQAADQAKERAKEKAAARKKLKDI